MSVGDPSDPLGAVLAVLAGDSRVDALVSGRVFGGELPAQQVAAMPQPAIVIRGSGGVAALGGGDLPIVPQRLDLYAYGAEPYDARMLYATAHLALKAVHQRVVNGTRLYWCQPAGGPLDLRDPDREWPYTLSAWQILVSDVLVA